MEEGFRQLPAMAQLFSSTAPAKAVLPELQLPDKT